MEILCCRHNRFNEHLRRKPSLPFLKKKPLNVGLQKSLSSPYFQRQPLQQAAPKDTYPRSKLTAIELSPIQKPKTIPTAAGQKQPSTNPIQLPATPQKKAQSSMPKSPFPSLPELEQPDNPYYPTLEDEGRCVLAHPKNTLGINGGTYQYLKKADPPYLLMRADLQPDFYQYLTQK